MTEFVRHYRRALNQLCESDAAEIVSHQRHVGRRRGQISQRSLQLDRVMRNRIWAAIDVERQRLISLAIKPFPFSGNQVAKLIIAKSDDVRVECAAEYPRLGMRRPATFEDRIIEEHSARAKSLIPRKQTTKAIYHCCVRLVKRRHRYQ